MHISFCDYITALPSDRYSRFRPHLREEESPPTVSQSQPTRRKSTPIAVIKKLRRKSLKSYTSATTIATSRPRYKRGRKIRTTPPDKERSPEAKQREEVMHTFYTKDEDFRATGRSICSDSERDDASTITSSRFSAKFEEVSAESYYRRGMPGTDSESRHHYTRESQYTDQFDRTPQAGGRRQCHLWEAGDEVRRQGYEWEMQYADQRHRSPQTYRHTSEVYRNLVKFPNRFSQSQPAIQWMLDVYSRPGKSGGWKGGVNAGIDGYRSPGRYVYPSTTEDYKPGRSYDEGARESLGHTRTGGYYDRRSDVHERLGKVYYDGLRDREVGVVESGDSTSGFEWSEVYPVMRTTSKFLIDHSKKGFHSKPLSLPPIERVAESQSQALRQHNTIIHVKLPKLPIQT